MPDVIQCPTCSKRFRLPERPPAVFTCTGCGTGMDLSAFRAAAEAAAPAAPAPAEAEPAPAGASSARRSPRGAAGARASSRSSARAGARGRRDRGGDADAEGSDGRHGLPPKKSNAVLWVCLGGLVVIIFVGIFALGGGNKGVEYKSHDTTKAPPVTHEAPSSAMTEESAPPPPPEEKHVTPSKVQFKDPGRHPDATESENAEIENLIQQAIFQDLGRDSQRAESALVKIGVKASPRLINVFATVKNGETFEDKNGRKKCAIADGLLRRIDGWLDRKNNGRLSLIRATSQPPDVERIAKQWFVWWENGSWKEPKTPWDERTEGNRGEGRAPTEDASMGGP